MSARPEYYSGRGVTRSDLSVPELTCIYRYIESGQERGTFPKSALDAFITMVVDIKVLAATPFIQNLSALEWRGWKPLKETNDSEVAVGKVDGHHDPISGVCGVIAAMGRDADHRERELAISESWKHQFLAGLQKPGLIRRMMRGGPSPDLYNTGYGFRAYNTDAT